MNSTSYPLILSDFLEEYKENHPLANKLEPSSLGREHLDLTDGYLCSARSLHLHMAHSIQITNESFVGADHVQFLAPTICLEGKEEHPLQVVAINGFTLHARNLKVQNVIFYCFKDSNFSLDGFESFQYKNIKLIVLDYRNEKLVRNEFAYYKENKELRKL